MFYYVLIYVFVHTDILQIVYDLYFFFLKISRSDNRFTSVSKDPIVTNEYDLFLREPRVRKLFWALSSGAFLFFSLLRSWTPQSLLLFSLSIFHIFRQTSDISSNSMFYSYFLLVIQKHVSTVCFSAASKSSEHYKFYRWFTANKKNVHKF